MTKTTLIKPRPANIIDIIEKPYKTKKEVEKVPEPTGFRIVLFPLFLKKFHNLVRLSKYIFLVLN